MDKTQTFTRLVGGLLLVTLLAGCSQAVTPPPAPTATLGSLVTRVATQTAIPLPTATNTIQPSPTTQVQVTKEPYRWQVLVGGLRRPTDLADVGGGRLWVLEQAGTIRVLQDNTLQPGALLDLTDRVGSRGNEQGLLGIALHPQFDSNGYFYVNYTDLNGNTVIARYQEVKASGKVDRQGEKIILQVKQPFANHNGGGLAFGPDGFLYIALGDGGSAGDPQGNGQSLQTMLGKILRIDINEGDRYGVPSSNPFVKGGGLPEIWLYGLRNPWRFSFDRLTNDLYIADVGQNQYEEIDFLPAPVEGGVNFGWKFREGAHPYAGTPPAGARLVDPVSEYRHDQGCSVTGGFVYRGSAVPELQGIYVYGDYCTGRVWGLQRNKDGSWTNQKLFETATNPSSFGQDRAGELYLLDQGQGQVLKLVK